MTTPQSNKPASGAPGPKGLAAMLPKVGKPLKVGDKIPVPPPKSTASVVNATNVAVAKNGTNSNVAEPTTVPPGTIVDGYDCTGMTDDPKKAGIPVWLQTQNRKALTPEQLARVKEHQTAARAKVKAEQRERAEMAKQLGMAPTEMRKHGAKLKSETQTKESAVKGKTAKTKTAAAKPAKAKDAPTNLRPDGLREGSKNAIMLDMVIDAGAKGVAEKVICKKLGWAACGATLRKVCDRVGVKLSRGDEGRFVASGKPKKIAA